MVCSTRSDHQCIDCVPLASCETREAQLATRTVTIATRRSLKGERIAALCQSTGRDAAKVLLPVARVIERRLLATHRRFPCRCGRKWICSRRPDGTRQPNDWDRDCPRRLDAPGLFPHISPD